MPPSPTANPQFHSLWPALHVIGKDIIIPAHGIYWLAMLHAIGFADADMPRFLVHGYILVDGEKMSKSLGNTTDPHAFADRFGVEALRYYLMRECVVGQDMEFTDERLVQRYNSDLANSLGNLLNRTLAMAQKYRQSRLTRPPEPLGPPTALIVAAYKDAMDGHRIHAALEGALTLAAACNQFIEAEQPWKLAKHPAMAPRLDAVLYELAETLRIIAILLSTVLPDAAEKIFAQLNWPHPFALADAEWGRLPDGHVLGSPVPVFPRLEETDGAS
jgi:methionyl-tRNA synthetase